MNVQKMILALVAAAAAGIGVMTWTQNRMEGGATESPPSQAQEAGVAQASDGPVARITEAELADGFLPLLKEWDGRFNKHGWNHYGPGWFTLDHETGVLASHGGMGLLWYSEEMFGDFTLRLEFMTSVPESNSGIFLRVPDLVTSDDYVYHSFEVQIHDTAQEAIHQTGAVYDAEAPSALQHTGGVFDAEAPTGHREHPPGVWHDMEISFVGDVIGVVLNGEQIIDWEAEPRGKITDFADRGYIGLQNHDWETSVYFRNIRVKRLD